MKKIHLIFKTILFVEFGLITILFFGNPCGNACDPHSLLNPFGFVEPYEFGRACNDVCVWRPIAYFYITFYILLLTIILYIVSWMIGKKFTSDNSVYEVQEKVRK